MGKEHYVKFVSGRYWVTVTKTRRSSLQGIPGPLCDKGVARPAWRGFDRRRELLERGQRGWDGPGVIAFGLDSRQGRETPHPDGSQAGRFVVRARCFRRISEALLDTAP